MILEVALLSNNTFADRKNRVIIMEQKLGRTANIVQHKGVEIIISDYTGLNGLELTETLKENTRAIATKMIGRRDCVVVSVFKNCLLTEESVQYIAKIQKAMDGMFVATAVVGMSAIQKAAIEITGALKKSSFVTGFFENQEDAVDWVAEEYKKFANRIR